MSVCMVARGCVCAAILVTGSGAPLAQEHALASPDGKLQVTVIAGDAMTWAVTREHAPVLEPSRLSLSLRDGRVLGRRVRIEDTQRRAVRDELRPAVAVKSATIRDHYNELLLRCAGGYDVVFRAYDDGVAYRFVTRGEGKITVTAEEVALAFPADHEVWFPEEESFVTHQERRYLRLKLSEISPQRFCSVPALVAPREGAKVLLTESDLYDYPGLYLEGTAGNALRARFPHCVLKESLARDRDPVIDERADFLAITDATRSFPWRVAIVAPRDGDLLQSQLVYQLARPCEIEDTSWIRPGKVAWDWYNACNLFGVDFRAGVYTRTYEHYIDFAARHGIEYVILDEGWYVLGDLLKTTEHMDLPAIFRHARERNVGVIPWVVWKTLDDQLEPAMAQFRDWGAVGIKVDFMQRDDQWMVNYYWRIARAAAAHRLLVDFHGAYKPAGLRRAYPNVITREGVKGLENNKWSEDITPEHNVTLPFLRMVAGPMDYTPGSMVNAQKKNFRAIFERPMSQGTRCHQLAMFVVYESPLQMLADSPSHYEREPECLEFLSIVPTVWDETRVLAAQVGDYVAVARRRGDDWYVAAMTDWTPRTLAVDCGFLASGEHDATVWEDGINADRYAEDYRRHATTLTRDTVLSIRLAPGGGWAACIRPHRDGLPARDR